MTAKTTVFLGLALGLAATVMWAAEVPQAVSPGLDQGIAHVADVCPTFSWSGIRGARAYELVVYEADVAEGQVARPVVSIRVPGAASSWTPSVGRCLARGSRYAWFVRAVGLEKLGKWSEGRVFEVAAAPTVTEVEQALELLQRYLEAGELAALPLGEAAADTDRRSIASTRADDQQADRDAVSPALGGADFSIDESGNVAGASFTGDGSGLTGVAATTATRLAANGSNCSAGFAARGGDSYGNAEACFDTTTQTELDTHKGSGDHDAAYVESAGDTMTGPLTLLTLQPQFKLNTLGSQADLLFQEKTSNRWSVSWSKTSGHLFFHDWQSPGGDRMVIKDDTGNVGIGTVTPDAKLDVGGLARIGGSAWPSSGQGLELAYSSADHRGFIQVFNRAHPGTWGELYLGNGRVGIGAGALSPGTRLDVVGAGTATGGVSGYDEVMARFKQTVPAKHSAVVVDALTDQDSIIYLSEDGQARWGIRSDNDRGAFQVRYHAGGSNNTALEITPSAFSFNSGLYPSVDDALYLGSIFERWKGIWLTSVPIVTSDRRLKEQVTALGYGLSEILRLRPVSYVLKDSNDRRTHLGLIAQEVEPLIPEAVRPGAGPEEPWAMTYASLTPVLIKAIQDQQTIIESLRERIESLETGL
jgi:hypothetical protein